MARPGRYPLTADMRISDLIRAAGGLKQSADLKAADLTHYVWKDEKQVTGEQEQIALAGVLSGDSAGNRALNNGDVLSIRQVPGWEDLGASITIRGEVLHPGSYGIRPGERLSSVLTRAGGLAPGAYPYGAVLLRSEVQKLEQRSYGELVQRVREQQATLKLTATSTTDPDQKLSAESALVQWQTTLDNLASSPPTGRVTIQVSSNIRSWANTSRDITVRAGDIWWCPNVPAMCWFRDRCTDPLLWRIGPGKSARWYLPQAGGTPQTWQTKKPFLQFARMAPSWVTVHPRISGDGLSVALQPGIWWLSREGAGWSAHLEESVPECAAFSARSPPA